MTINMACRLALLVDHVTIVCPDDIPLRPLVIPLPTSGDSLREALLHAAETIGVVAISDDENPDRHVGQRTLRLHIGPGEAVSGGWRVHGQGWWGGVTRGAIRTSEPPTSMTPVGPYVAACLAVGEVFRELRTNTDEYPAPTAVFYDAWRHHVSVDPPDEGPELHRASLIAALGGMGAVGNAFAHTLWAWPQVGGELLAADPDPHGVDASNLNRGVLFTHTDIGRSKTHSVAPRIRRDGLLWKPVAQALETVDTPRDAPQFVVGAVDTPEARAAIQSTYPYPLIYASTKDFRAEVVNCDPRGDGPCMRCHNPPQPITADDDLAARYRQTDLDRRARLARRAGVQLEAAEAWAADPVGRCGEAGERVLGVLREAELDDRRMFAVPFVSVFAGVILAAETVKTAAGLAARLAPGRERTVFTFLDPVSPTNGAGRYRRDPTCPQCRPDTPAGQAWARRAAAAAAEDMTQETVSPAVVFTERDVASGGVADER